MKILALNFVYYIILRLNRQELTITDIQHTKNVRNLKKSTRSLNGGYGALLGKMLLVRIIKDNKIDAFLGQVR